MGIFCLYAKKRPVTPQDFQSINLEIDLIRTQKYPREFALLYLKCLEANIVLSPERLQQLGSDREQLVNLERYVASLQRYTQNADAYFDRGCAHPNIVALITCMNTLAFRDNLQDLVDLLSVQNPDQFAHIIIMLQSKDPKKSFSNEMRQMLRNKPDLVPLFLGQGQSGLSLKDYPAQMLEVVCKHHDQVCAANVLLSFTQAFLNLDVALDILRAESPKTVLDDYSSFYNQSPAPEILIKMLKEAGMNDQVNGIAACLICRHIQGCSNKSLEEYLPRLCKLNRFTVDLANAFHLLAKTEVLKQNPSIVDALINHHFPLQFAQFCLNLQRIGCLEEEIYCDVDIMLASNLLGERFSAQHLAQLKIAKNSGANILFQRVVLLRIIKEVNALNDENFTKAL